MVIKQGRPAGRGVTQLMYVGDDEIPSPVRPATTWWSSFVARPATAPELGVGVACGIAALQSTGITRLATGGIATLLVLKLLYRSGHLTA